MPKPLTAKIRRDDTGDGIVVTFSNNTSITSTETTVQALLAARNVDWSAVTIDPTLTALTAWAKGRS